MLTNAAQNTVWNLWMSTSEGRATYAEHLQNLRSGTDKMSYKPGDMIFRGIQWPRAFPLLNLLSNPLIR